ncbi:hypothetical protein FisN_26Lh089 [Fistulifera solaris]|uniref:Kinesin-like protein n=1 Tax=Fistulifera solaris TaxID=1519565 RepID=A0A1Z5KCM4_FISSO|nr:hypothetical protein FisN_26Lh089 [Fistulifera solaris]|eukprot:GAX24019.1 hypothetical protein FisN_26Lh089 [Fistulifera solaris]
MSASSKFESTPGDSVRYDESKASNVRVMVRVRPLKDKESCHKLKVVGDLQLGDQPPTPRRRESRIPTKPGLKSPPSLSEHSDQPSVLPQGRVIGVPKKLSLTKRLFHFDAVFPSDTTQSQLYHTALGNAIENNIFKGYNMTILAYGQTGSGKTHTMYNGTSGPLQPSDGIVRRAISDLFRCQELYQTDYKITIAVNCLELFNEEFRDLLSDAPDESLKMRNYGNGHGVTVEGSQNFKVRSWEHADELVHVAATRRVTGSTQMNAQSSRSHAVYTFIVTMEPRDRAQETMSAKLTMVDLAGSEKIKKSGVVGSQQKESININKDLFVLGKVVSMLAEKSTNEVTSIHIPYRDSKLTEYLQDSLGGNSFTLLIACISPADSHSDESMNTLRYAERSRSIANHVKRNTVRPSNVSPTENALQLENNRLRAELNEVRKRLAENKENPGTTNLSHIEEKIRRAKEEARATRESCLNVANQVSRWRDRRAGNTNEIFRTPASSIDPPETHTGRNLLQELTLEGGDILRPKLELTRELVALSNQIDQKRSELESLESASLNKLDSLKTQIEVEECKRDELEKEVIQMKHRIHLMATNLRDDNSFPQIFRSRSEGDEIPGDVEMKILSTSTWKDERLKEVEAELKRVNTENKLLRDQKIELVAAKKAFSSQVDAILKQCDEVQERNVQLTKENEDVKAKLAEVEERFRVREATLLEENDCLKKRLKVLETSVSGNDQKLSSMSSEHQPIEVDNNIVADGSSPSDEKDQEHAAQKETLIRLLERAVEDNVDCADSLASSSLSISEATLPSSDDKEIYIDNMKEMKENDQPCKCGISSVFAKKEYVVFYLPKIGVTCSCGKRREDQLPPDSDPSALRSILREWQVDFLESTGIQDCVDFLHAVKQRKIQLAREMRVWRKKKGLPSMKTQSCSIAIYIWSRTCRVVLRNLAEQKAKGATKPSRPNFLDISLFSDEASMSTIGLRSACGRRTFV